MQCACSSEPFFDPAVQGVHLIEYDITTQEEADTNLISFAASFEDDNSLALTRMSVGQSVEENILQELTR